MVELMLYQMKFMSTILGCFFVMFPCGVAWYWGNLSVYVYSYSLYHHNTDTHEVKAPWLLSVYIISWSSAMLAFGQITKYFNRRLITAFAIVSFNGGLLSSYFVLGYPITWMDFTMGILSGMGNGLLFAMVMQTVVEWTERRVGLVTSTVAMSVSVGAVLINQLVTHTVNPRNLKVDTTIGRTKYFSQKEILESVPSIFLILVALTSSCQIVGFCLIRHSPPEDDVTHENEKQTKSDDCERAPSEDDNVASNNENDFESGKSDSARNRSSDPGLDNGENSETAAREKNMSCVRETDHTHSLLQNYEKTSNAKTVYLTYQVEVTQRPRLRTVSMLESSIQMCDWEIVPLSSYLHTQEWKMTKTPSEVLRSRAFYVLWIMLAAVDIGFVLLCNYYKAFGELYITDDHFLTNLGTSLSVTNIVMRLFWGIVIDSIGIKTSLIGFATAYSIVNCFYVFTPIVSKWLFFFWSLVYGGLIAGVYINFATIVMRLYGKEHFNTNFGLLFTATIATNLVVPTVFRLILKDWGWSAMFLSSGGLCFVSLVLVVCLLPHKRV